MADVTTVIIIDLVTFAFMSPVIILALSSYADSLDCEDEREYHKKHPPEWL